MQKLIEFLKPVVEFNTRHPFWVLLISMGLATVAAFYAVQLKIDTDIANLLPDSHPNVQALEHLQEVAGGETELKVGIKSPSFDANVNFARALIDSSLQLYDPRLGINFFNRVEFKRETDVLKDNALYLATTSELQQIIDFLQAEIDEAREEANPFFVDFTEDFEDEENTEENSADIDEFRESYDTLIPPEYPVNSDSTLVMVSLFPSGSQNDIQYLEDMFERLQDLINRMEASSYHPEMEVRFGGRLKRHLNEFESIMNDVYNSFALGISSVILLVMFYFGIKKYINYRRGRGCEQQHGIFEHIIRMPVPVIIIGLPLLISLMWTFGIVYLVLGVLNTMTSVLFVILFGLGIDYGIHFYARYIEIRSAGNSIESSVVSSYKKTGTAILVSAVTTASALFILLVADFRGFSEFGFIAGLGIILALFCMLYVLPALIVIFDRWNWILLIKRSEEVKLNPVIRRFPFSRTIVIVGVFVSVLVLSFSGNLRFEYDFGKLEPEFEEYEEFREFIDAADRNLRRNPAYIIADNTEDVFKILEKVREKMKTNPNTLIEDVEALQERFPPTEEMAREKLEYISRVRELLQNDFIVNQESETLDILRRGSKTRQPLDEERIPDFLKNRFMTRDGDIGRFVIVYPESGLSDGLKSIAFKEEVGSITLEDGSVYYAASTSIVAATMLDLMRRESPYMVTATFIVVFVLILISFRSFRWTLIALIPLLIGLLWLFGILLVFGLKFNFYNLVVLPAILGIGCDNGVHLAHRFRDEGKKNMWEVLSSTGQHITIGSITTMMGFAGLLFTNHPGLQSIGVMAVVGIGMTLFTAITFLPSIVQLLEDRNMIHG